MADKYTIQIQPQINRSDAMKMERDLNKRFSRVAGKFSSNLGKSLKNVLKLGLLGVGGAVAGAILTNPFEKINQDLNDTLEKFDNTATRAAEFGVSSGRYFQAEQIASSAGVKDFDSILARFSEMLNKARTGEDRTLQNFTGEKNILDAFYNFSESLGKLDPTERNRAVEDVFGARFGLRIAELLQTDIPQRKKQIFGDVDVEELTKQINKIAGAEELQAIGRAKLAVSELNQKSGLITTGVMKAQAEREKAKLGIQTTQLSQYEVFAKLTTTQERASQTLEGIRSDISRSITPLLDNGVNYSKKIFDFLSNSGKSVIKKTREIFE